MRNTKTLGSHLAALPAHPGMRIAETTPAENCIVQTVEIQIEFSFPIPSFLSCATSTAAPFDLTILRVTWRVKCQEKSIKNQ